MRTLFAPKKNTTHADSGTSTVENTTPGTADTHREDL